MCYIISKLVLSEEHVNVSKRLTIVLKSPLLKPSPKPTTQADMPHEMNSVTEHATQWRKIRCCLKHWQKFNQHGDGVNRQFQFSIEENVLNN